MKTDFSHLDQYRLKLNGKSIKTGFETEDGELFGAFRIPSKRFDHLKAFLRIICAPSQPTEEELKVTHGWKHVSVHGQLFQKVGPSERKSSFAGPNSDKEYAMQYTPTWDEMCFVKNLFFNLDDTVVQIHPPVSKYVNQHPNTLHLWEPPNFELPPSVLV